jgi:GntR family transcriptional regulator
MLLRLSDTSPLPLREQIVRRLRELILSGELVEQTHLPSIRGLAREQRVGVITVQRAYENLEREGMVYARQGKGYFVAALSGEVRRSQAEKRARQALAGPIRESRQTGLSRDDVRRIVNGVLAAEEDES